MLNKTFVEKMATSQRIQQVLGEMEVDASVFDLLNDEFERYGETRNHSEFWLKVKGILGPETYIIFMNKIRAVPIVPPVAPAPIAQIESPPPILPPSVVPNPAPQPVVRQRRKAPERQEIPVVVRKKSFIEELPLSLEDYLIESQLDGMACMICTSLMLHPVIPNHRNNCGISLCENCVKEISTCPNCRGKLEKSRITNVALKTAIWSMKVKCWNECGKTFTLEETESHIRNFCPLAKVKCNHGECTQEVLRRDLEEHQRSCPSRPVKCDCDQLVPFNKMDHHKDTECDNTKSACTFNRFGCDHRFNPAGKESHEQECPFVKVGHVLLRQEEEISSLKETHPAKRQRVEEEQIELLITDFLYDDRL